MAYRQIRRQYILCYGSIMSHIPDSHSHSFFIRIIQTKYSEVKILYITNINSIKKIYLKLYLKYSYIIYNKSKNNTTYYYYFAY